MKEITTRSRSQVVGGGSRAELPAGPNSSAEQAVTGASQNFAERLDSVRVELSAFAHQPLAALRKQGASRILEDLRRRLQSLGEVGVNEMPPGMVVPPGQSGSGVTYMHERERTLVHVPRSDGLRSPSQSESHFVAASPEFAPNIEGEARQATILLRDGSRVSAACVEQLALQCEAAARENSELPLSADLLRELVESRLELVKANSELSRLPCPPLELVQRYEELRLNHERLMGERRQLTEKVEQLAVEVRDLKATVRRIGRIAFEAKIFEDQE